MIDKVQEEKSRTGIISKLFSLTWSTFEKLAVLRLLRSLMLLQIGSPLELAVEEEGVVERMGLVEDLQRELVVALMMEVLREAEGEVSQVESLVEAEVSAKFCAEK